MGIRIHKSIGYAIDDFAPPENWEDIMSRAYNTRLSVFLSWYKANEAQIEKVCVRRHSMGVRTERNLLEGSIKNNPKRFVGDYIIYDQENGQDGVLQLLPVGLDDYKRYDDIIDWVDAYARCGENALDPEIIFVGFGLYPYMHGEIPSLVAALALWLNIPEIVPRLRESIYTYWG